MIRRPPRSTLDRSSAASDVYKRQPERRQRLPSQHLVEFLHVPFHPTEPTRRLQSLKTHHSPVLAPVHPQRERGFRVHVVFPPEPFGAPIHKIRGSKHIQDLERRH